MPTAIQVEIEIQRIYLDMEAAARRAGHQVDIGVKAIETAEKFVTQGKARIAEIRKAAEKMGVCGE